MTASYVDVYLGSWSWLYGAVRRVNQAIYELNKYGNMAEDDKTRLVAELRFMRAFIYFDLAKRYKKLKYICLTLGKNGAMIYDCKNRVVLYSDKPKGKPVSTVGAGDSFAACFLTSLLSGYAIEKCLDRAIALSDYVVTQLGAVPEYDPENLFSCI